MTRAIRWTVALSWLPALACAWLIFFSMPLVVSANLGEAYGLLSDEARGGLVFWSAAWLIGVALTSVVGSEFMKGISPPFSLIRLVPSFLVMAGLSAVLSFLPAMTMSIAISNALADPTVGNTSGVVWVLGAGVASIVAGLAVSIVGALVRKQYKLSGQERRFR